jgi:8-amino-7-oxononanoate synthase
MEGAIAPVKNILDIAHQYKSSLIIDDAHGIGVLGEQGGGICEYSKIDPHELACVIAPLGKAFNAMGAIVAGRSEIIEAVLQFARSYRYSTALPPAICVALLTTLDVVRADCWRRDKLANTIQFFTEKALARGLRLSSTAMTPIKSVIVGDSKKVSQLQKDLLTKGFFVSCIRPPTVANNTARVRICLNANHTQDQVSALLDHISDGLLK